VLILESFGRTIEDQEIIEPHRSFLMVPTSKAGTIQSWRGPMGQSKQPTPAERPDENPYAPPSEDRAASVDEKATDQVRNQRTKHLRRESCIRIAGLIGLILAGCGVLTFGFGTLFELFRQEEDGIELWMYRRWIARMLCVISIAILAFVTSWGLFRLRNWGRWALTIVTTLPLPVLICAWLLLNRTANPEVQESIDRVGLTIVSVISTLPCTLLLFLMWSPKGSMVFSPEYREIIRQTPHLRSGCSGIFPALLAVSAELFSYFVLLKSVLSILAMMGLIRSI
jgi:hypothetical protein